MLTRKRIVEDLYTEVIGTDEMIHTSRTLWSIVRGDIPIAVTFAVGAPGGPKLELHLPKRDDDPPDSLYNPHCELIDTCRLEEAGNVHKAVQIFLNRMPLEENLWDFLNETMLTAMREKGLTQDARATKADQEGARGPVPDDECGCGATKVPGTDWCYACMILCKLCRDQKPKETANPHRGDWICDDCWDERLRTTA